jgi:hypothetical protein
MRNASLHQLITCFVLVIFACSLSSGCSGGKRVEEQSNLRSLAAYYSQYLAQHRGKLPADEKELKSFITADLAGSPPQAAASVDDLFISNRDGKPFVVKYRGNKSWRLPDIVAYEQEGGDGTRHVATSVGGYEELTEEAFRQKMAAAPAKR